jgi:hypothetical protein
MTTHTTTSSCLAVTGKPHTLQWRLEFHRRKKSTTGCEILPETITRRTKSPYHTHDHTTFAQLRFDVHIYLFFPTSSPLAYASIPFSISSMERALSLLLSCGLYHPSTAESLHPYQEDSREDAIGRKSVSTVPYFPYQLVGHCTLVLILAASESNLRVIQHQIASLSVQPFRHILFVTVNLYTFLSFSASAIKVCPLVVLVYFVQSYLLPSVSREHIVNAEKQVARLTWLSSSVGITRTGNGIAESRLHDSASCAGHWGKASATKQY